MNPGPGIQWSISYLLTKSFWSLNHRFRSKALRNCDKATFSPSVELVYLTGTRSICAQRRACSALYAISNIISAFCWPRRSFLGNCCGTSRVDIVVGCYTPGTSLHRPGIIVWHGSLVNTASDTGEDLVSRKQSGRPSSIRGYALTLIAATKASAEGLIHHEADSCTATVVEQVETPSY